MGGAAWELATRREGIRLDLDTLNLMPLGANKGGNSLAGSNPATITAILRRMGAAWTRHARSDLPRRIRSQVSLASR